ncbi:Transcription initiation factor IIF subunit alpha [Acorus calamus]|uniref:Transcription initiation factor IIF subunit alpha n=1 Tax=Acorus calamus TaxID=4465 RepID=A0AAV9E341_ACOCL|nr:Transcription initiation factor IIF subunit alpha [Acorus calamus]
MDLVLKRSCEGCGSTKGLYGSNCKHVTLCFSCGKAMAAARSKCYACGSVISRLIRVGVPLLIFSLRGGSDCLLSVEYKVRVRSTQKLFQWGDSPRVCQVFQRRNAQRTSGLSTKKASKGGKLKNKPWILEDETGQHQYRGQIEGAQSTAYYILMMHGNGKEFVAVPTGSWYNFNKIAQYKQLTLEEAEDKMRNRRKTADGYERWMMKAEANGAAAFGAVEKTKIERSEVADGNQRRKGKGDSGEDAAEKGEEDGGEEEMSDDWEHVETFTDDDEAASNDPLECLDLVYEPTPFRIKDDAEDEEHVEDGGAKLTAAGKELKKLLRRAGGLNELDTEKEEEAVEDEVGNSAVLAPKQKDVPKEIQSDNISSKEAPSGSSRGISSVSKSGKSKRKHGSDNAKTTNGASVKKAKTDNDSKPWSVLDEPASNARNRVSSNSSAPSFSNSGSTSTVCFDIEDEIRTVMVQIAPVTAKDLVAKFKSRLQSKEDKAAFREVIKRMYNSEDWWSKLCHVE